MKKLKLLILSFLFASVSFAQTAQDFTLTDLNGNTHNLYSYLNDNKIVILDFWATWCGPCLASIPTLDAIWDKYGPEGDQTVIVLSIEIDNSTTNELQTIAAHGITTPVITAHQNVHSTFGYGGSIPFFVVICPNKTYQTRTGGVSQENQLLSMGSNCGVTSTIVNDGKVKSINQPLGIFCTQAPVSPSATIQNIGTNNLTSATIELFLDGELKSSQNWTGSLAKFATTDVFFPSLPAFNDTSEHEISVVISNPNNAADDNSHNNEKKRTLLPNKQQIDASQLYLELMTDNYGTETSWKLFDGSGAVIAQGPAGSTYGNNTLYTETINISNNTCYEFVIYDEFGDGICCDYGNGYYKIFKGNSNAGELLYQGGDFNTYESRAFNTLDTLIKEVDTYLENLAVAGTSGMAIYPNPANNNVTVAYTLEKSEPAVIRVFDIYGKMISTESTNIHATGINYKTLDISTFAQGVYFISVETASGTMTEKLTVLK